MLTTDTSPIYEFQFTHPGGVRPEAEVKYWGLETVSIHAPGRGATVLLASHLQHAWVSIHAPGRGATHLVPLVVMDQAFQFTHPGGVRLSVYVCGEHTLWVSIHAPGRGATGVSSTL